MDQSLKQLTDFLMGLGIEEIPHTRKSYLGHLISVYQLMKSEGCSDEVCRAGLFHSIYGTQQFQGFKLGLERRAEVRDLIGSRAERLAYLNCAMDRSTLDSAALQNEEPYRIKDRLSGEDVWLAGTD